MDIYKIIGKCVIKAINTNYSLLDEKNILWKFVNDDFIGKRSVLTYDLKICWLEDTKAENVKTWLCGENSDYKQVLNN